MFSFENISRLPILISRIEIISKDKSRIQCSLASEIMIKTTTKSGKDGSISNNSICTTQFPIPISSLGGTSERVVFNDEQNILDLIQTTLQKNKKEFMDFIFPILKSSEGNIRFYVPSLKYDFDKAYFETTLENFSKIIIQ